MGILWEGLGMGARTIHEHPNPDALIDPDTGTNKVTVTNYIFMKRLYDLGIRYIRDGGTDPYYEDDNALPGTPLYFDSRAKEMKNIGLHVIYGACYVTAAQGQGNITPNSWANHVTIHLAKLALYYTHDAFDIWSLGNEQEQKLGTVTAISFVRTSNVVTATFASAHGFLAGQGIVSAGATPTNMNVTTTIIDVPTPTTLTFAATGVDGTATGTCTVKWTPLQYALMIKAFAVQARAIAPDKEFLYTSTSQYMNDWITAGIIPGVDLDYYALNEYGSSATDLNSFRSIVVSAYAAFGDRYLHTEFNLYFNNETQFGQVPTLYGTEYYTRKRLDIMKDIGVKRVYYFLASAFDGSTTWGSPWDIMSETNLSPRNAFYELFSERKKFYIDAPTRASTIKDLATPTYALRRNGKEGVNRGKCADFAASNSAISFGFLPTMDPANMPRFTLAVRIYLRSLGGGTSGRVIDSINQRFINIQTQSAGYTCQLWHSGAIPAATTRAMRLNTWECLFMDWNDLWLFPRVYLDCVESTQLVTNKSGSRLTSSGQIGYIGNRSDLIRVMDGKMDDFYIFDHILTPREKNSYMNGLIPRGVKMGYKFEETTGDVLDVSGNNINGTPINLTRNIDSYVYP